MGVLNSGVQIQRTRDMQFLKSNAHLLITHHVQVLGLGIKNRPDAECSNYPHSCLTDHPTKCGTHQPPFYYVHDSVGQRFSESTKEWLKHLEKTRIAWPGPDVGVKSSGYPLVQMTSSQHGGLSAGRPLTWPWIQRNREMDKAEPVRPHEGQALTIFYRSKHWHLCKGRERIEGYYLVDKLPHRACLWGDQAGRSLRARAMSVWFAAAPSNVCDISWYITRVQ